MVVEEDNYNGSSRHSPSSMFLIRTERSTTSLSAWNCSLSEVTSRTIMNIRMSLQKGVVRSSVAVDDTTR